MWLLFVLVGSVCGARFDIGRPNSAPLSEPSCMSTGLREIAECRRSRSHHSDDRWVQFRHLPYDSARYGVTDWKFSPHARFDNGTLFSRCSGIRASGADTEWHEFCAHYTLQPRRVPPAMDKLAEDFQAMLFRHQFRRANCSRTLQILSDPLSGTGIGARFHTLVAGVFAAFASPGGKRVVTLQPGGWRYTSPEACPLMGHECYFRAVTACQQHFQMADNGFATDRAVGKAWGEDMSERVANLSFSYENLEYHNGAWGYHRLVEEAKGIPRRYVERGGFWLSSQIIFFLLQPDEATARRVDRAIRFEGPYIAMHVRQPVARANKDKLRDQADKGVEAPLHPFKEYMAAAEEMRRQYGVHRIWLSTDDPAILKRASREYPQFTFHHTDYEPLGYGSSWENIVQQRIQGRAEGVNAIVNIFVCAQAEYFIGTFSSNFTRTILMLAFALYSRAPHLVSLDSWSHSVLQPYHPSELRSAR